MPPKRRDGPPIDLGAFLSTYEPKTVREILLIGARNKVTVSTDVVEPPILRDHYVSEDTDTRFAISAGNRVETDHEIIVDLEVVPEGTRGRIYVSNKPTLWGENAIDLVTGMRTALRASSAPEATVVDNVVDLLWT